MTVGIKLVFETDFGVLKGVKVNGIEPRAEGR